VVHYKTRINKIKQKLYFFLTDCPNFSKSKSMMLVLPITDRLSITNLAMTYISPCKEHRILFTDLNALCFS